MRKEIGDVFGEMLAVAVEGDEIFSAALGGVSKRGEESDAFTEICWMTNDGYVEGFEKLAEIGVGAAIIDDDYMLDLLAAAPGHLGDRGGVVKNRNATPDLGHAR